MLDITLSLHFLVTESGEMENTETEKEKERNLSSKGGTKTLEQKSAPTDSPG